MFIGVNMQMLCYVLISLFALSRLDHSGATDTYHVSAGDLFLLKCLIPGAHSDVTWSRVGRDSLSLPTGVETREGLLWFLPVQVSHNATYTCQKRYRNISVS